jgi:16S rRNA (cytosine1402-N4)-methyltransferase
MGDGGERHVRRKRYRGSHPRSFSEKYKEHDPERYREHLERVLSRGDTPAGSHRSIMVKEVLEVLRPLPGERAVDATLGYGGHSLEILRAIQPGGVLVGFDRDAAELPKAARRILEAGIPPEAFIPVQASFSRLAESLAEKGVGKVDLFLADLGVSSMQIDDPERGFSWKRKGPLDMRMDRSAGAPARDWLARIDESGLAAVLRANADEECAEAIARAVCLRRGRLHSTRDLAEAISAAFPDLTWGEPALTKILRRSFQAIRIEVNGEFSALEELLRSLPACMAAGGRAAFLSFHSGEDRRVEASFRAGLAAGLWSAVAEEPLRPGKAERYANPRSSSAKLRWAIRAATE